MFLIIYLLVCSFLFFFFFKSKNLSVPLGKSKECLYRPVLQECTLKFNCSSQSLYESIRIRNRAQSLFHLHLHHPLFSLLYEIENAIYFIGQFPIECLQTKSKVIVRANQSKGEHCKKPMRAQSENKPSAPSAGKRG